MKREGNGVWLLVYRIDCFHSKGTGKREKLGIGAGKRPRRIRDERIGGQLKRIERSNRVLSAFLADDLFCGVDNRASQRSNGKKAALFVERRQNFTKLMFGNGLFTVFSQRCRVEFGNGKF